jgi:alpha-galactosidase
MPATTSITVIGAGSATFSLGLVKDLCLTENLKGAHVAFMDIDAGRLANITRLAERYSRELGADLTFRSTTDRESALAGADFVINTADVKGHHHARRVRELASAHGYYYYGAGIIGHYYNFSLMLGIARDMERICPDAWLIQSGNPVFDGTTLMTRQTKVKVIGLCHGHYGYLEVARRLGLDPTRVTWEAPGVNHAIWLTTFLHDGEDAYPVLDEWIRAEGPRFWETHVAQRTHDIQMSRGVIDMYKLYGLMPIGDTPRLVGWWYHTDPDTKLRWFGPPWGGPDTESARPVHVQQLTERLAQVDAVLKDDAAQVTSVFGRERTREQQVPIIDAIANGVAGCFQVNVPNTAGILKGVAEDVVVEGQAWIDRSGVHPMRPVRPLPARIFREEVSPKIDEMERGLEAYLTGDRRLVLLDILADARTRSREQAEGMLNALLAMPGHEEAASHFR